MPRIVLVDGRFEISNGPGHVDVYDVRNRKNDAEDRHIPLITIQREPMSDKEAGRLALNRLLDDAILTQREYFQFLEIFLAVQSMNENRPERKTIHLPAFSDKS